MSVNTTLAIAAVAAATTLAAGAAGAQTLTTLYEFKGGADGAGPNDGLLDLGGTLYGTTVQGGANGYGTVFTVDGSTGTETVLYNFQGTAQGGHDGTYPGAGLVLHAGVLYGTTLHGGTSGLGTVYKFNPNTGKEAVVYSFAGGTDGLGPASGLICQGGALYGTTTEGGGPCNGPGGSAGCGTVFKIDLATGAESIYYHFKGGPNDGQMPLYGALIYHDGFFYGTTYEGGAANGGTVFKLDATTGAETVLHSFAGGPHDGAAPYAGVVYSQGRLYGATSTGGGNANGTVFSVDPATGAEKVIYNFGSERSPSVPMAGLIAQGGLLYGTTSQGGTHHLGTVFSIDPATGGVTLVYSFIGGRYHSEDPGGLVYNQGTLYGTTGGGGGVAHPYYGTVYKLTP
jgi:uncharacterized repeat protein (TIGR03803 family)